MSRALVVVGAGGFGRETLDVVEAINAAAAVPPFTVAGVVDDAPSDLNLERLAARAIAYLGPLETALTGLAPDTLYAVAIGRPQTRRVVVERLDAAGLDAATLVHPGATVGSRTSIGKGAIVCGGVQVSTNVTVGAHVHVNPSATIGHDTVLQDFVSVNPAAVVSGECTVEVDTLIGAAAVVLQGLVVGAGSVVGASACVVRDVPVRKTVKGVPAR